MRRSVTSALHPLSAPRSPHTPSHPDASPRSDRFRCGGRESKLLAAALGLITFCAILFGQCPVSAQAKLDAATEISVLRVPFQAAMEKLGADFVKLSSNLQTWYLTNLDKLQTETAKRGDLDGAVAIKAERDRIAAHTDTAVDQVRAMALPLRTLRGTYEAALKKNMDEGAWREAGVRRNHLTNLDALQKRITITGDIEQALLIKAERERFAAEKVGLAPPLPASAAPTESTKPDPSQKKTPSTTTSRPNSELLGAWRVHNLAVGKKATYDINPDNTFKMNGRHTGTWEVKQNQLTLRYDHGGFERYDLPAQSGQLKGTNDIGQSETMTRKTP